MSDAEVPRQIFVRVQQNDVSDFRRPDGGSHISCTGCGFCAEQHPDIFEMKVGENGFATSHVIGGVIVRRGAFVFSEGVITEDQLEGAIDAAAGSPSESIDIIDTLQNPQDF